MNLHATVVAIGSVGCLIKGPSGSGKTTLALAAIGNMLGKGAFAALVADDQCLIRNANNRVIALCPPALKAMAEMRGLGVVSRPALSSTVVDIVFHLCDPEKIERMPSAQTTWIAGVELPVFELPARQIVMSLPLLCQIIENRRL